MTYCKINTTAELRKFLKGKPTKVDPAMLLTLIGERYLAMIKSR